MGKEEREHRLLDEMVVIKRPDGSEVRIPRSQHHEVVELKSRDKIARLLLVGSVLLNFGGGVAYFLERQFHKEDLVKIEQILDSEVLDELNYRVDRLEVMGCINENRLNLALGNVSQNIMGCIEEWDKFTESMTNFEREGREWLLKEK